MFLNYIKLSVFYQFKVIFHRFLFLAKVISLHGLFLCKVYFFAWVVSLQGLFLCKVFSLELMIGLFRKVDLDYFEMKVKL